MIVYLEMNFLLELAFGRQQAGACRQLLNWCAARRIDLRLPAYAFTEARSAFRRREKERLDLVKNLQTQEQEFARLHGSADIAAACRNAAQAVAGSIDKERTALAATVTELRRWASFAPLDETVAETTDMLETFQVLSGDGDRAIFASLLRDLIKRNETLSPLEPSLFVTRDSDYGVNARKWLRPLSCDLLHSYDAAVGRLNEALS